VSQGTRGHQGRHGVCDEITRSYQQGDRETGAWPGDGASYTSCTQPGHPADGQKTRAQAEGEADALRTKGEAKGTCNAKVASSLTPTLFQQQYLMRWNGQLPQYMLGGDNSLLVQLAGGIQK
jgi:hypothetical protein